MKKLDSENILEKKCKNKKDIFAFLQRAESEFEKIVKEKKKKEEKWLNKKNSKKIESRMVEETFEIKRKTKYEKPERESKYVKKYSGAIQDYLESVPTISLDQEQNVKKLRKFSLPKEKKLSGSPNLCKTSQDSFKKRSKKSPNSRSKSPKNIKPFNSKVTFGSTANDFIRRDRIIDRSQLKFASKKGYKHYGPINLYDELEREEAKALSLLELNKESIRIKKNPLPFRPFTHYYPNLPPHLEQSYLRMDQKDEYIGEDSLSVLSQRDLYRFGGFGENFSKIFTLPSDKFSSLKSFSVKESFI